MSLTLDSRPITAFSVAGRGHFQFKRMPFGLHSASANLQRILEKVLGSDLNVIAFVYMDDVLILGKTLNEHVKNVIKILRKLRGANLRINEAKSEFLITEIHYLGHLVNENGIQTDPEKIKAISEMTQVHEDSRLCSQGGDALSTYAL